MGNAVAAEVHLFVLHQDVPQRVAERVVLIAGNMGGGGRRKRVIKSWYKYRCGGRLKTCASIFTHVHVVAMGKLRSQKLCRLVDIVSQS